MATSVKLILDDRRPKEDGTFPIVVRLTHNRISRYIQTGYSAHPDEWDDSKKSVISKSKPVKELKIINSRIRLKESAAADTILDLEKFGELDKLSASEVKDKILNKNSKVSFRVFTEKIIKELTTAKKFGNASVYRQAIDFIDRYTNGKDYTFDQITYQLIKHLEAQHLSKRKNNDESKGNSLNSLSFYFRTIRAVYNRAIKEGIAKRDAYPFINYSIKQTKTAKRAIHKSDIDKIRDINLEPNTNLWHARNYFMFSFYNIGMNFIDIAYLKMSNIVDGRFQYIRAKTGKSYSVKISEPAQKILSLYTMEKKPNDFVFNVIKGKTPEEQLLTFKNVRRSYTKWLKKLANLCGIESNLTSYVARHSWATIAKDLNVPISVISEGLGHEDIKTTQIYLDSFDDSVIDKANQLIIG
jgi:site-specific recombinase XerD